MRTPAQQAATKAWLAGIAKREAENGRSPRKKAAQAAYAVAKATGRLRRGKTPAPVRQDTEGQKLAKAAKRERLRQVAVGTAKEKNT